MFRTKLKQFIKNPVFIATYLGYLLYSIYYQKRSYELLAQEGITGNVEVGITFALTIVPITFMFFMILSYSFYRANVNCKIDEVICSEYKGNVRDLSAGILFMLLISILYCIIIGLPFFIQATYYNGQEFFQILNYGIKVLCLYCFLPIVIAILLGLFCASINKNIVSMAMLILFLCLFNEFICKVMYEAVGTNKALVPFIDLFNFTCLNHNIFTSTDCFYSVDSAFFEGKFIIILCIVTSLRFLLQRKQAWCVNGLLILSILILGYQYFSPSQIRESTEYIDSIMYARNPETTGKSNIGFYQNYKEQLAPCETDNMIIDEDFHILKYQGTLTTKKQLEADVKLYVDRQEQKTYQFTLWHDFKLSEVKNDKGEPLKFTQVGDWITIYSNQKTTYIEVSYAGFHQAFTSSATLFSTNEVVCLPGSFCYLPFSGRRYLCRDQFLKEEYEMDSFTVISGADYCNDDLGYPVEYDINVQNSHRIHSNIPETEGNNFVGKGTGLTLFTSPSVHSIKVNKTQVVYSNIDGSYINEVITNKVRKFTDKYPKIKNIILYSGDKEGTGPLIQEDLIAVAFDSFIQEDDFDEMYQYYMAHKNIYGYWYSKHKDELKNLEKERMK